MQRRHFLLALPAAALLPACGGRGEGTGRRRGFFGGRRSDEPEQLVPAEGFVGRGDPRPLVDEVATLVVELTPGGALVRATGYSGTQGYSGAELVPITDGPDANGVQAYTFRVTPPTPGSPLAQPGRQEILVATFIPEAQLRNVREVRVIGAQSSRRVTR